MSRSLVILIMVIILFLNLPWFFTKPDDGHILGFPYWAFYSLIMIIVFAVAASIMLGWYWSKLAEGADEVDPGSQEEE